MPRINEEKTLERDAWAAHAEYLAMHFPGASINEGWAQDWVSFPPSITSKVYGEDPKAVTTFVIRPSFPTEVEDL